jgi:hypothetical protein
MNKILEKMFLWGAVEILEVILFFKKSLIKFFNDKIL